MIIGIGNDILELDRFRKTVSNARFLKRYFTEKEIALYDQRHQNTDILAGNFAVKESISKVFGTGVVGFDMRDIEVLRADSGKPVINLYNNAKSISDALGINRWHVSISHHKTDVAAFVIGEKL